jgi:hypothetical protein
MQFYKKILLLFIVIIFTYILYRLYLKRLTIINNESFEVLGVDVGLGSPEESELQKVTKNTNPVGISSLAPAYTQLPLSQYIIKSSFNSAITGNYVNLDMLKYVLSRGCRFIDFEVYAIKNSDNQNSHYAPYVAYSTDPTHKSIDTQNKILLDTVLTNAIAYGFNTPSPNANDPLFIQLRIKSNNTDIYKMVAKSIKDSIDNRLYNKNITSNTKYSDIKGKVVIVIDKTIRYDYTKYSKCNKSNDACVDLTSVTNIESGSELLRLSSYNETLSKMTTPPIIKNDNKNTDATYMQLIVPPLDNMNLKNPVSISPFIRDYGCQMIAYRFYILGDELDSYEEFFKDNGYGIVPMSLALQYLAKKQN